MLLFIYYFAFCKNTLSSFLSFCRQVFIYFYYFYITSLSINFYLPFQSIFLSPHLTFEYINQVFNVIKIYYCSQSLHVTSQWKASFDWKLECQFYKVILKFPPPCPYQYLFTTIALCGKIKSFFDSFVIEVKKN